MSMQNPIVMVDLAKQYQRLESEIQAAMKLVLEKGNFIQGQEVQLFESELADFMQQSTHVISCANGTDALQLAFMALDLPKNAEVIMPAFTYAALAEVVLLLGLKPVFVDVDPETYLIDIQSVKRAITPQTKVIAVVHLFGAMADMDAIMELAVANELYVIEDAAQAIGSYYSGEKYSGFAGCIGDIGTTSFFPSKNLGCYGDGGAVFTSDKELMSVIRSLANHGQDKKYYHERVGINSRLDTLQAAILRVKLGYLNEFNRLRNEKAEIYTNGLLALANKGYIKLPKIAAHSTHVFHQYTIQVLVGEKRDAFRKFLLDNGISSMVYYPLPLHRQNAYKQDVMMDVAESLCNQVISLPICPELSAENQHWIIQKVNEFFAGGN